jgi:macrolide transport system ATP-binding/permease protein
MTWLENLRHDLRFGGRLILKAPGFSAVAILTLAIGVGASTTIFSQISAIFWTTLPVPRPYELRTLVWSSRKPAYVLGPNVIAGPHLPLGDTYGSVSYLAYVSMRDGAKSFANLACWADLGEARPIVMREVGFGAVHFVSSNYFDTLRVDAMLGRTFRVDDDTLATTAAILSYPFWQRTFGGDRDVLRKTIDLNGKSFAIVGVMPPGFFGVDASSPPDVIVPTSAIQIAAATNNPMQNPGLWQMCRVVGRLRAGVSDEQARADAERWLREAILARPPQAEYELPRVWLVDAGHGLSTLRDAMATPLIILMAVVTGILLIAATNIAGLQIVRGAARRREIATRLALGASRGRVVWQLLTESLLLSIAGGLVGVALAFALARVSATLMTWFMPTLYGVNRSLGVVVTPDARVLLFSAAITVATGLVFGCLPAFRATRMDLISSIKQATPVAARTSHISADKAMVAVQTALSLMLIVGAGLLARTIANLRAAPLGYQPDGLLYVRIEPRTGGIPPQRRADFFEQAVTHLEATPGVLAATATDSPPLARAATIFLDVTSQVCTPGYTANDLQEAVASFSSVAPRFFETIRSPLAAGRDFTWSDRVGYERPTGPFVAIVNEAFARKFFAGKNPLEQRFGLNCPAAPSAIGVIGVVADSRTVLRRTAGPTVYFPLGNTGNVVTVILRTAGPQDRMIPTIRHAMREFNATVPTFGEVTPIELREQQMQQERLLTDLLLVFGAIALLLSSIGIYGMLAYMVTRRTSEIGIRMALGAQCADVVRIVVRESVRPVAAGLALGAAGTIVATRWIDALLFGVSAHDPWTVMGAAVVFLVIAAAAAVGPAWRASRVDPLRALRVE